MQAIFTFFDKNNKSDKFLFDESNYLDNNKLFVDNSNYPHNIKLLIDDNNTFNYNGNIKICNNIYTLNSPSNNNLILPNFSIIHQCNQVTYIAKIPYIC